MIKSIVPNVAFVRNALWFVEYGSYSFAAVVLLAWLTQPAAGDSLGNTIATNQNSFFALENESGNPLGDIVVNLLKFG